MTSHKNDNTCVCPHCGSENNREAEIWLSGMDNKEALVCGSCKNTMAKCRNSVSSGNEKPEDRNFNLRFFIITALLSCLMIYLNRAFDVFSLKNDWEQIVYEILIVLLVSSSLSSGKIWVKLKYLAIWAGIFLFLMTGYSYRHELTGIKEKVLAEMVPAKGFQQSPDSVSFPVSSDGHFYIRAHVNGVPILFLADTGASHIVLSPADAEKIGFKKSELDFDRFYETANGNVRGSSIRIAHFRVGEIHLKDIGASVNGAHMRNSLLGMTFFRQLQSYEVKNNVLTLYWRK